MKKYHQYIQLAVLAGIMLVCHACQKGEILNLNTPTDAIVLNPSKADLNNLVSGVESGMRRDAGTYLDDVSIIGREIYRFSNSEPRWVTDMLTSGLDNNTFYLTNPWASRYLVIRQCWLILQGAANCKSITDAERKGYTGFAKTIIGYQLLLNLNLTDVNGVRIPTADPTYIGPVIKDPGQVQDSILKYLADGAADLSGSSVIFSLSTGFTGFKDAAGLTKFNRALAARVDAYRKNWANVLTDLNGSFMDFSGKFSTGVYHFFSTGGGDQVNPNFIALNQTGEVRAVHPSFATDMMAGDDRISKAPLRNATVSQSGLSSNRDLYIWTALDAPISIIRNEELILLYAEAKIQLGLFPDAQVALNTIRTGHNLPPYGGANTTAALLNELLYQRRYSLLGEGHRWIDLRRYGRLGDLPIDRPNDKVWPNFPLPQTEVNI
ncbi:MAG: RagB/SusD family nutrient uptake outer membrane protein [Chitinophaga sp.]|uniref:RagB/SusD family nutrient uptake outer membrane protein n=1 Tax=Chitinophaga sp. TaxID=1869181 RepID=UPI0025BD7431|nr:RagB/SusD family nutrient uptake outer membrane protein [Chitinophaga sp.]MBV8253198.1 RagB/SusD family nutrient uptake outer membrane protein [Chitinophaga sp.]